jgi:hypothetical protein
VSKRKRNQLKRKRLAMFAINELLKLATPEGQTEFLDLVREVRTNAGQSWLQDLESDFPLFYEIADLVVNHSFDDAYKKICSDFPSARLFKSQLQAIHTKLKFEIEKKQF